MGYPFTRFNDLYVRLSSGSPVVRAVRFLSASAGEQRYGMDKCFEVKGVISTVPFCHMKIVGNDAQCSSLPKSQAYSPCVTFTYCLMLLK
jgi:hypothetical protein